MTGHEPLSESDARPRATPTMPGARTALVDLAALEAEAGSLRERYGTARPFPHVVIDDFLPQDVAERAAAEFPSEADGWTSYVHANERKAANAHPETWGPTLRAVLEDLSSERFVRFLEVISGIDDLLPDESLEGGGLHECRRGGFLNIHSDFTAHPRRPHWRRRINLLLYLNPGWQDSWGGDLEFWGADMHQCEQRIAPISNRVVVFNTDVGALHGHPDPLRCPESRTRRSLALYYFTEESALQARATLYRPRPGDGARALPIWLDNQMLRAYDWAKRRFGFSDALVSRAMRRIGRRRAFGEAPSDGEGDQGGS